MSCIKNPSHYVEFVFLNGRRRYENIGHEAIGKFLVIPFNHTDWREFVFTTYNYELKCGVYTQIP